MPRKLSPGEPSFHGYGADLPAAYHEQDSAGGSRGARNVMQLSENDIQRIAAAVVAKMRASEETSLDMQHLASLPLDERRRRLKAESAKHRRQR